MKKKKILIIIVCIFFVIFGGANVYASIKGYGNVINLVKNMVEKKEEKEKNETIEENIVEENEIQEEEKSTDEDPINKISKEELKKVLGTYALLNSYEDVFAGASYATKDEWDKCMKVEIAMEMIYSKEEKEGKEIGYTVEKINKAIKEFCGEEYTGVLDIPRDGAVYYDSSKKVYENALGDYKENGACLEIENLEYVGDGIYEAQFTYCYPTEENYTLGNVDKLAAYETTMRFRINENYTYAKYCLVFSDNIEYKKIKENEINYNEYDYGLGEDEEQEDNNTTDKNTEKEPTKDEILTSLKKHFTDANNSGEKVEVIFRKYENKEEAKEVKYGTLLLNWFIGEINNNIDSIDNKTTYTEWCNRDLSVVPKEEYLMMFMYNRHQTQITWSSENKNQIVILWYNDDKKDIEVDKINLNKNGKEVFETLMDRCKK